MVILKTGHGINIPLALLWFYLLIFPFLSCAQGTFQILKQYTQRDGLSSNYILGCYQDHQGYLWIGTENGLNRFDGKYFVKYGFDPDDNESLNDNWARTIFEDKSLNLWIGTETGLNRLNRKTGKIERVPIRKGDAKISDLIVEIKEGVSGNVWVLTRGNGMFRLDQSPNSETWEARFYYYGDEYVPEKGLVRALSLIHAEKDVLWISTTAGLDRFQVSTKVITRYHFPDIDEYYDGTYHFMPGVKDSLGNLYFGMDDKFYTINIAAEQPQLKLVSNPALQGKPETYHIKLLNWYQPGILMYASFGDIGFCDVKTGKRQKIVIGNSIEEHKFSNPVRGVFEDKQGNFWAFSSGSGLFLLSDKEKVFTFYENDPERPSSISAGTVRTFLEDQNGDFWVGVFRHGLNKLSYSKEKGFVQTLSLSTETENGKLFPDNRIIKIIWGPEQHIWVAANAGGIAKLDNQGKVLQVYAHDPNTPNSISANRVWALAADSNGYIWAGTWQNGLNRINPITNNVKIYSSEPGNQNSLSADKLRHLLVGPSGVLWIGTDGGGLNRFDPNTEQFTHFKNDPEDPNSLSHNLVWCSYIDSKGELWVGTKYGLNHFDKATQTFERFFEKDGLPSNTIYGFLEDDNGLLWISTADGLAVEMPPGADKAFLPLSLEDGLQSSSFIPKSYIKSSASGQLFFGSSEGIVGVQPQLLENGVQKARYALHSMSKFNPFEEKSVVETDYFPGFEQEMVKLNHRDQSVTFTLSDLSWDPDKAYRHEYQLVGFNRQWVPIDDNLQMTFTNLAPGKYALWVRTISIDNSASEAIALLRLSVSPPWWWSWWAILVYIVVLLGLIMLIYRFQFQRQLEKRENEQLKSLNRLKDRLYTNITHEFRTPLTIIRGMVERMRGNEKEKKLVLRNSENLLNLVNQILDLRKIESGKMPVQYIQGDIIPYLRYIFESFDSWAAEKQISMEFVCQEPNLIMDFDQEKVLRILSNLVSNAIKFTPEGGSVFLMLERQSEGHLATTRRGEYFRIKLQDSGIGIDQDELPHIFDRFYQTKNEGLVEKTTNRFKGEGTGIGLALVKELVSLLDGQLTASSKVGHGTAIQITLPIHNTAQRENPNYDLPPVLEQHASERIANVDPSAYFTPPQHRLLIVEDNPDILEYLSNILGRFYQISFAKNGQEGVDKAFEDIPDLIISDVMMPKQTGFELTEQLKNDERTSHIPIILLTARADVKSRITGLKQGADAYLAKPFNQEELLVRMQKLLELRQSLQLRYSDLSAVTAAQKGHFQKEDAFITKLRGIIEENISDETYGIQELCRAMGLSRSQLHKKIKALTNRSTSHYIRAIRLHRAKALLQEGKLTVTEIAYEVGYKHPSYFSSLFSEEFGISPSEFIKR